MRAPPLSLWNSAQLRSVAKSQVGESALGKKNFPVAEKPERACCLGVEKVVENA